MARDIRALWTRRVREWKRSGLTGAVYAERLGVKEQTLRHWKWQLGHEARRARAGQQPAFIEVEPAAPEVVPGEQAQLAELTLVLGETRVLVPKGFDEETLRRVLVVLERR